MLQKNWNRAASLLVSDRQRSKAKKTSDHDSLGHHCRMAAERAKRSVMSWGMHWLLLVMENMTASATSAGLSMRVGSKRPTAMSVLTGACNEVYTRISAREKNAVGDLFAPGSVQSRASLVVASLA